MSKLTKVRLGIIGVGGMGASHARSVLKGEIPRCELTAVCDARPEQLKNFDSRVQKFTDSRKLIRSGLVDAVLIATPHYQHTTVGVDALNQGLHVLVEKPISVHKADCERFIAAHKGKKQVFAAMFNQRTHNHYRKVKDLIDKGELGDLIRVTWIITGWFRTDYYYAMGDWRATWAGEGGGVLLNQCPHQLDLLQWYLGMPSRVRAFCALGKWHDIEVEDDVTAYLEYPNGATGVFITTTGEAPGTNRLEINGQNGKLVVENDKLHFTRNEMPVAKYCRTSKEAFGKPSVWNVDIPVKSGGGDHSLITKNFVEAILDGAPLLAPGREGIRSVELGNAMLYSSLLGKTVELPLDGKAFERKMNELIRNSRFHKKAAKQVREQDLKKSFV
jgi:predicted dehydrogenase